MHPRARIADLHVVEHHGGLLIHDSRLGQEHELHPLTALVWKHADGETSVAALTAQAQAQFGPGIDTEQVWAALDSLSHANLLETRLAPPAGTQRVGRRTLLRHVATGSVAAAALGSFVVNTAEAASPAEQVKKLSAEQSQKAGALAQEQAQKLAARNEESRAKLSQERSIKQDAAHEEHAKSSMEHQSKSSSNREVQAKNSFGGNALDLGDGWTSYGSGYQPAAFTRSGELLVLGGVISGDLAAGQVLGFLPEGQRPVAAHIFQAYARVNGREGTARVEVQPDGQIVLVGQAAAGVTLSLSGISFRAHALPRSVATAPGMQEERIKLSAEESNKSSAVEQNQKLTSNESATKLNAEQDSKLQFAERESKVDAEQNVKLRNQEEVQKLRAQEEAAKVQ